MTVSHPLISTLREMGATDPDSDPNHSLALRDAAAKLEKYELLKETLADVRQTIGDGRDAVSVSIAIAKLNRALL